MNWLDFFQNNGIHYRTSGANVSAGGAVIHCPWCGQADQSEHLVVSLEGKGFKCWKSRQHAGRNPAKLIQALLNCSWEQATSLAGQQRTLPNDFMNKVRASIEKPKEVERPNNLKIPPEFKRFTKLPSCRMYLEYINRRGFTIKDAEDFGVYYASTGPYKGRVLLTIYHEGKLCGWTGRTVFPTEELRYKSLTSKVDKAKETGEEPAPKPIGHYLLFRDYIVNSDAETIVMCEGPFDAWKVNVLGKHLGAVATCFFTNTPSAQQINQLHEILPKFKNKVLLLDQGTFSKTARTKADLTSLDVRIAYLPANIKDPGELKTIKELQNVLVIV